jgi:hypothetical protein
VQVKGGTMEKQEYAVTIQHLSCQVCLSEVPLSEAGSEEATDYLIFYFGLDCFDKWRHLADGDEA